MNGEQLRRLIDVSLSDLARIRAGVDQARVVLADTDDIIDGAHTGLAALKDQLGGDQR